MSALSLVTALRAARRTLLRAAEAVRPELERRIAEEQAEAAVWTEETAEGADLWIAGDGLDPERVRRLVTESLCISDRGEEP